jgi:hypothetical protein
MGYLGPGPGTNPGPPHRLGLKGCLVSLVILVIIAGIVVYVVIKHRNGG